MQYTIRNVPPELDRALKAKAKERGVSVNQLLVEMLSRAADLPPKRRSLREMPGEWSKQEARRFDEFLANERRIDEELWK